jgi:uncharacterized protein (DUF2235 family)
MGHRPKNIVVCCDGTGQQLDVARSNVVRLFSALDRRQPEEQVAYYDPGVGTMPAAGALTSVSRQLTIWAGLIAGYGVLDNVARAYAFIVNRYLPGDRIYLLGFSRGALTVRLVAGLLHRVGVLRPDSLNMFPYALQLYGQHYTHLVDPDERRRIRDINEEFRRLFSAKGAVEISFLGMWDTVKALGVFRPGSFPHLRHNPSVRTVRHAIALDESRRSYMFTSWGGLRDFVEAGAPPGQNVREVWFAGDHRDIGGGHPEGESGRSWRSFRWMAGEASQARLNFDDSLADSIGAALDGRGASDGGQFFKRHRSRTPGWRLLDLLPRYELENAPPRTAQPPAQLVDDLPVPLNWPKLRFKLRPTSGERHARAYRRDGPLLVHWSVKHLVEEGEYALGEVCYVDDAPLVRPEPNTSIREP